MTVRNLERSDELCAFSFTSWRARLRPDARRTVRFLALEEVAIWYVVLRVRGEKSSIISCPASKKHAPGREINWTGTQCTLRPFGLTAVVARGHSEPDHKRFRPVKRPGVPARECGFARGSVHVDAAVQAVLPRSRGRPCRTACWSAGCSGRCRTAAPTGPATTMAVPSLLLTRALHRAGGRVEDVDLAVAEVAHQQHVGELAEVGRRHREAPGGVQHATGRRSGASAGCPACRTRSRRPRPAPVFSCVTGSGCAYAT